jgi:hypothetical protein
MKKLFSILLILFIPIILYAAAGGKPGKPPKPPPDPVDLSAYLRWNENWADYWVINIGGVEFAVLNESMVNKNRWDKDNFQCLIGIAEGIHPSKFWSVFNGVRGKPILFDLIFVDFPEVFFYEIQPYEGYEFLFDNDQLILEIPKF